ncbi:MAG: hypothetical protein JRN20_10750 [Nitrososphaerota archaeon]|nr:hypothetical protein [Nitrososphaerota archaeon]
MSEERDPAYTGIDVWWAKIVPGNSLRTRIIQYISQYGPSSAYDIAKATYERPTGGYASVLRNLKELEADNILKVSKGLSQKGGKRNVYAFTEFIGIPCAWAYAGPDFDFDKLLEMHRPVFEESKGLEAYRVMWEELGPDLCVEIARKSFLAIIQGLDDRNQIFNMLVAHILDGTIPRKKIASMVKKADLIGTVVREVRDQLSELLKSIEGSKR